MKKLFFAGCAMLALPASQAAAAILTGSFTFNDRARGRLIDQNIIDDSGVISGTFSFDTARPSTLTRFTISQLDGLELGSTRDFANFTFSQLPIFTGAGLTGAFSGTGSNSFVSSFRVSGNFGPSGSVTFATTSPFFGRAEATSSGSVTYVLPSISVVPEPASWAMMITGFGVIGGVLRRRNRSSGMVAA